MSVERGTEVLYDSASVFCDIEAVQIRRFYQNQHATYYYNDENKKRDL